MGTASRGTAATPRAGRRRGDLALLALVGGVVPLLATLYGGAMGVPRNDDWAHGRTLLTWVHTGHLHFGSWSPTTLIGQLAVTWPFAELHTTRTTLQLVTVAEGLLGLAFLWGLARAMLPGRRALMATLAIALTPMWIPLAVSYMTDVPAMAFAAGAAWSASRAADQAGRKAFLVRAGAALAFAVWATAIRQNYVVVLVVVAAALVVARRERRAVATLIGVAVAATAAFLWWRVQFPPHNLSVNSQNEASVRYAATHVDRLALSLGVLVLPIVALSRPLATVRRVVRRHPVLALGTAAVIGANVARRMAIGGLDEEFIGDYVTRFGSYKVAVPGEWPALTPGWVWMVLVAAAAVALWVLLLALADLPVRGLVRESRVRATLVLGIPAALVALMLAGWVTGHHPFDRYLIGVVPFLAIALQWGTQHQAADRDDNPAATTTPPKLPRVGLAVAVACYLLALFLGVAAASADGSRWKAALATQRLFHVAPDRLFAGLEWNGTYTPVIIHKVWSEINAEPPCVILRQFNAPNRGPGVPVFHSNVLGVDRWYRAERTGAKGCGDPRPSG